MDEKQLLKKITLLKEIKPSQEWVNLTKQRIFKDDLLIKEKPSFWQVLFTPIQRPVLVFAFRGVIVLTLTLTGSLFYLYYLNTQLIFQKPILQTNRYNIQKEEKITAMLEEIREGLGKIELSLNNLKNSKDQNQALAVSEVIKITASTGEKTIKEIKQKDSSSPKILASLAVLENDFKELKEASREFQKEKLGSLLEDLKQRSLTEEQETRLQKAEQYYNEGNYNEAIFFIIKIMEKK